MGGLAKSGKLHRGGGKRDRDQQEVLGKMVQPTSDVDRDVERRHHRRPPKEDRGTKRSIGLLQLCSEVAYLYRLTPKQIAEFSGQQLVMWYETALQQIGFEKDLDLEISVIPHTEEPDKAFKEMRKILSSFGKKS